jgi:hypothetical protein
MVKPLGPEQIRISISMIAKLFCPSRDHSLLGLSEVLKPIRNPMIPLEVKIPGISGLPIDNLVGKSVRLLAGLSALTLLSPPAFSQAQLYPSASGSEFAPVFSQPPTVSIDAATGCPVASFYLNGFSRNANNSATMESLSNQNQFDNYGVVGGVTIPFAPQLMLNCRKFMQGVVARQGLLRKNDIATFCATLLSNKTFSFDLRGYVNSLPEQERKDFDVCTYITVIPEGRQDRSKAWDEGPLKPFGKDDAGKARTLQILVPSK